MELGISRGLLPLALALGMQTATAAIVYSNPLATYSQGPSTQLGAGSGNSLLTVSSSPDDITVAGKFLVVLNAPTSAGTLVSWQLDRPIVGNSYGTVVTTETLLGFSAPPLPGTYGNTFGSFSTYVVDSSGATVPGSLVAMPLSLVNGFAGWGTLSLSSAPFSFPTTGSGYALRQNFQLDGIFLSGPGGTWVVDVPAGSGLVQVPEPGTLWLSGAAGRAMLAA